MGWAYCGQQTVIGPQGVAVREIGYGIEATCDQRGCHAVIDRGLGCLCGEMHHGWYDEAPGCGRYFCGQHLGFVGLRGGCQHRSPISYGQNICQPMRNDQGQVWCACHLAHYVEWTKESAAPKDDAPETPAGIHDEDTPMTASEYTERRLANLQHSHEWITMPISQRLARGLSFSEDLYCCKICWVPNAGNGSVGLIEDTSWSSEYMGATQRISEMPLPRVPLVYLAVVGMILGAFALGYVILWLAP